MFTDTVRALASDAEMLSSVPGRKLGGTTLAAWDVHCPYDGSLKKAEHYFGFLPFFHKSKNPLQISFSSKNRYNRTTHLYCNSLCFTDSVFLQIKGL